MSQYLGEIQHMADNKCFYIAAETLNKCSFSSFMSEIACFSMLTAETRACR